MKVAKKVVKKAPTKKVAKKAPVKKVAKKTSMPTSGYEPTYDHEKWTNDYNVMATHNCYSYLLDDLHKYPMAGKPQPGLMSNEGYASKITCAEVRKRVIADNPRCVITWASSLEFKKCPKEYYKGFLCVNSNGEDYHFYRQDDDGTWSHKPGSTEPTKVDASGKKILNPKKSNRNYGFKGGVNYNIPCSFFCIKNTKAIRSTGNFNSPGRNALRNPKM